MVTSSENKLIHLLRQTKKPRLLSVVPTICQLDIFLCRWVIWFAAKSSKLLGTAFFSADFFLFKVWPLEEWTPPEVSHEFPIFVESITCGHHPSFRMFLSSAIEPVGVKDCLDRKNARNAQPEHLPRFPRPYCLLAFLVRARRNARDQRSMRHSFLSANLELKGEFKLFNVHVFSLLTIFLQRSYLIIHSLGGLAVAPLIISY